MKKTISKISILSAGLFAPVAAFAQVDTSGLFSLLSKFEALIARVIPIIIGLALVSFLWGLVKYLFSQGDKKEARDFMLWGVIALFVMTSVWGLVNIVKSTVLGENNANLPTTVPSIPQLTR